MVKPNDEVLEKYRNLKKRVDRLLEITKTYKEILEKEKKKVEEYLYIFNAENVLFYIDQLINELENLKREIQDIIETYL
jgi:hypothetical protein